MSKNRIMPNVFGNLFHRIDDKTDGVIRCMMYDV